MIRNKYFFIEHNEALSETDIHNIENAAITLSYKLTEVPYPDPDRDSILSMIDKIGIDKK
jgi:hypothetical protein